MKAATPPIIHVEPEFLVAVESLLRDKETISEFVESSIREAVRRRSKQAAFLARGISSLETAARNGNYVDADVVIDKLQQRLEIAKQKSITPGDDLSGHTPQHWRSWRQYAIEGKDDYE